MDAVPHVAERGDGDADRLIVVVEGGSLDVVHDVHGGQRRVRCGTPLAASEQVIIIQG